MDDIVEQPFIAAGKSNNQYTEWDFTPKSSKVVQDFHKLREQCLIGRHLFEDPEFPSNSSSLFFSKESQEKGVEWKRPREINRNAQFIVNGFSRFDVKQGKLGDCWLLAAIADLTIYKKLFLQVVPNDQDFGNNYAGIFHFRFWQYGKWVEVVIDDRLPTKNGKLIYLHPTDINEFWSALLEKAYAKLHGSYEALSGGFTSEAMEDFTGGLAEIFELSEPPSNLFSILLNAYEKSSLMCCSLMARNGKHLHQGLIEGHAYSITCVQYVDIVNSNGTVKIPLIRIRNPWGNEIEWNGNWSDTSSEWQILSPKEKKKLGLTFDGDGEFWMSFQDFKKCFTILEICHLNPDVFSEEDLTVKEKKWETSVFEGKWVKGSTAGGCQKFFTTFAQNPQYRIIVKNPDKNDSKCTVIIALMQKNRRAQKVLRTNHLQIGFVVYQLDGPNHVPNPLNLDFFNENEPVARSPSFTNHREISCRIRLSPGTYCIVPSSFNPNEEGEFILRIFFENKSNMRENDDNIGIGRINDRRYENMGSSTPYEKNNCCCTS